MTTTEQGSPRLLHNMSSRPRTLVSACLGSPGHAPVRFRLDGRALIDHESLSAQLDEAWREAGLRGAVHVYSFPPAAVREGMKVVQANRLLSINVLGRVRGGLLLPGAPLALDFDLLDRELATDDPRFVALAAGGTS